MTHQFQELCVNILASKNIYILKMPLCFLNNNRNQLVCVDICKQKYTLDKITSGNSFTLSPTTNN